MLADGARCGVQRSSASPINRDRGQANMANQHTRAKDDEIGSILSRMSSLETGYEGLSRDVHNIAKSLEGFASETRTAIKDLASRISDSHKTPWGVLASWAAVVLSFVSVIGGLVAYGINGRIDNLARGNRELTKDFIAHTSNGHPRNVVAATVRNKERIEQLDTVLQREMRLLDQEGAAKLADLDKRLQLEMRLLQQIRDAKLDAILKRLDKAELWMVDHDKRVVGLNAAQWERIKALERVVYQIRKSRKGAGQAKGSD